MISGFKQRKPWAVFVLAFLLGPAVGMCYLNRGKLAVLYFTLYLLAIAGCIVFICQGIVGIDRHAIDIASLSLIPLNVIGIAHCIYIAQKGIDPNAVKWYGRWYGMVLLAAIIPFALAFSFRTFCYEPFHIPSASMAPTINVGDYLFVQRFAYWHHLPERGDVIVFRNPRLLNDSFIKRIIGLPGDKVQITSGIPYINNVALLHKIEICDLPANAPRPFYETLPDGRSYKILQNATFTEIDNTQAYTVPDHQYFVLGDNRDNSRDSRFPIVGFVPETAITGKAVEVLFNMNDGKFNPRTIH